ncbi:MULTISPECIES: MerC domain-containing protein [Sphingomonadaceae]|uniref:MerC domain-containing protein n=1 Tax=Sphingomonadales TaxID=204457 RepID=UPI001F3F2F29|nr:MULTISPECIES: MerC domain-containing protein [Sphingomonadaceae]MDT7530058.1 MerC domain-containing protein [Sphingopyxis sp. SE2]
MAGTLRNSHRGLIEHTALGASLLCLIHCLALPLLFAALPALSSVIPVSRTFHLVMLAIAVPTSSLALLSGRTRHGAWWPVMLGAAGLIVLAIGVLSFGDTPLETPLTVAGAIVLAIAHVGNLKLARAT